MPLADDELPDWRTREARAAEERDDADANAMTTRIQQNSCGRPRGIVRDARTERWKENAAFVIVPLPDIAASARLIARR
jgi:hypothetical protein